MSLEITQTVKLLRSTLGETQEVFAKRLGTAKSSLVRYESTRPPHGRLLAQLAAIAGKAGQPLYEEVFHKALAAEIGDAVQPGIDFRSDEERAYTLALLAMFRNPQYEGKLIELKALLEVSRAECERKLEEFRVAAGFERATAKLAEEGRSPESIADLLGIPLEAVNKVVDWQQFLKMANRSGLVKQSPNGPRASSVENR